jgi:hypothetical protein
VKLTYLRSELNAQPAQPVKETVLASVPLPFGVGPGGQGGRHRDA